MSDRPILDLTVYHDKRVLGDLTLYSTWVGADLDDSEPCLVLVPTHRAIGQKDFRPIVIALSAAFKYDDPQYLASQAAHYAYMLGFQPSLTRMVKIGEIIHGHLQDLTQMPPKPKTGQNILGEASLLDKNSGRTFQAEMIEDV